MIEILELLFNPLGVSVANMLLIIVTLGSIIFMALDLRIGMMACVMEYGFLYMVFHSVGWSTTNVFVLFMMSIVLLSLLLIVSYRRGSAAVV